MASTLQTEKEDDKFVVNVTGFDVFSYVSTVLFLPLSEMYMRHVFPDLFYEMKMENEYAIFIIVSDGLMAYLSGILKNGISIHSCSAILQINTCHFII